MIERLVLRNFKSHENSDIEFNPGLNVFLGAVGAGKTSILEAVAFSLFGKYAGTVNQNGLIRRGAEKADITLFFSTSSGRYKVNRTIYSEKTQKAKLWIFDGKDWNLAVEGATAVSKSMEDILDVDASTFLAAIYASQGEIKEMLETQPGKRRERLDKLLGIDMYENIWKILGDARNIVLNELTESQEEASGLEVLEKQADDLKDRLEQSKKDLKMFKAFLKEIKDRLQPAEQQLKILEDLKQQLSNVRTRIEGKNNEIRKSYATLNLLKEKIKKAEEAEDIYKKNSEFIQIEKELEKEKSRVEIALQQKKNLETFLQRDNADLQELLKRKTKLENQHEKLKALEDSLETLKKEMEVLPELKKEQAELEKKLDKAKMEAVKALNEIENQKRKVERITELGECPTCLQTVPNEHKEKIKRETREDVAKLKAEYTILEDSRIKVQAQLDNLKKKIELAQAANNKYLEATGQIKQLEDCRTEIMEVEKKIRKTQARIKENREKTSEIKETPETLDGVKMKLKKATLKADVAREAEKQMEAKKDFQAMFTQEEKSLKALNLQLRELQSSEKELTTKYDQKKHDELEKTVKALRDDLAKTTEDVKTLNKSIEDYTVQITQYGAQLEKKRKAQKQVEKLKMENSVLEILRRSLRDVVQPAVRKNSVFRVSNAFQSFYQELSNDNIDHATIDEEGNLDVVRNGEPSPVNSLSGGETTCAALALRLAICSSLTKNQLLLLDEPTIHLDELYREKLRDFLSNHNFEQLIVVTHDNTFDSLPAQIFRMEKRRGESIVSPLSYGGT